jgi:FkbM family methyltransferase
MKLLSKTTKLIQSVISHPLNEGQELRALARFLSWQVRSRLTSPTTTSFIDDTRLLLWRTGSGATGNIYFGLAEWIEMSFALHLLRPKDLFVDVGANLGSYTVLAAGAAGANVVCFEPIAATRERLVANIAVNNIQHLVEVHSVGIGETSGNKTFSTDMDAMNRIVADDEPGESLPIRSLDDVLAGRRPRLIKIDVEGFELDALKGARETLAAPETTALIIEIWQEQSSDVLRLLDKSGFKLVNYDPLSRRLVPADKIKQNGIFVRDIDMTEKVVQSSRTYRTLSRPI